MASRSLSGPGIWTRCAPIGPSATTRLLLITLVLACAFLTRSPVRVASAQAVDVSHAVPVVQARAAVVIDAADGRVLYEKNGRERLPPASLTKMVTALVALERGDLGQPIVATVRSLSEPSVIGMAPGDRLPLSDALYGMLLNSGNDVALAIAESLGNGSTPRFVGWMNSLVRSLGTLDTRLANPTGLDIGEHYSSAYDLAVISRVLLRQPVLRTMVGALRHDYAGPPLWAFRNINRFLTTYPGADGIKTGYEDRAGRCLAASAARDGHQLIAVVLNSLDPVADSAALMDFGFATAARVRAEGPVDVGSGSQTVLDRLLPVPNGQTSQSVERSYLRSIVKPDLAALNQDPTLPAGPASVYERLMASLRLPPTRL